MRCSMLDWSRDYKQPAWRCAAGAGWIVFAGVPTTRTRGAAERPRGDAAREPGRWLVREAPAEDTILVLGGDCTVGVGTVAGLRDRFERLGLVYVDRMMT